MSTASGLSITAMKRINELQHLSADALDAGLDGILQQTIDGKYPIGSRGRFLHGIATRKQARPGREARAMRLLFSA